MSWRDRNQSDRKVELKGFDARLFLGLFEINSVWLEPRIDPLVRSRDPDDDMLLELACTGPADFLVTGDEDLLVLADHPAAQPIQIVRPADFLSIIDGRRPVD